MSSEYSIEKMFSLKGKVALITGTSADMTSLDGEFDPIFIVHRCGFSYAQR